MAAKIIHVGNTQESSKIVEEAEKCKLVRDIEPYVYRCNLEYENDASCMYNFRQLQHPNIIQVMGLERMDDNKLAIVMTLINDPNLHDVIFGKIHKVFGNLYH